MALRTGRADTPTEALRQAGYSENTVRNVGKNFIGSPLVQRYMAELASEYERQGIGPKKIVEKQKEWLDAHKKGEPDYHTQLKAGEYWRKDMQIWSKAEEKGTTNVQINNFDPEVAARISEAVGRALDAELFESQG